MLLTVTTAAQAQGWKGAAPAYPPPPVPHCDEVFVRDGDRGIWVGHYSGRYPNPSFQGTSPYGAIGCFLSEAACRQWLHQNMSFAGSPMIVMSCRPATRRTLR